MASKNISYKNHTYHISYEIQNQDKSLVLIFLHGWGSNKEIMKQAFLNYFNNYKHIYIDLPGFGNSNIVNPINTNDYANIMSIFFLSLKIEPFIILGHSFGGKVATLLNPKILVLLSTAGIIEPKPLSVKVKIKLFKLFKNIIPKSMYKVFASSDIAGMNQTMYEVFKNVVNENFVDIFKKVTSTTFIYWGKKDKATAFSSGKQISNLIDNSKFNSYDGDHFFFIKYAQAISLHVEENI